MPAPLLDELQILIVVDNETDTLSSVDPGLPQTPELLDHIARSQRGCVDGHTCTEPFEGLCIACHGFSALLRARIGAETRCVLFDVGPRSDVWLDNAKSLDVDLAAIETVFLSHWHFDHSGALPEVVSEIATARRKTGRAAPVVDLHPDRPDQRGFMLPDGSLVLLPPEPSVGALEAAGGRIELNSDAHGLADDWFYASGAIPRQTTYETGFAGHHSIRAGRCEADPLIMDERFVAAQVRGRGVTLLSACSHAGIVNASLAAAEVFRGQPVDLVLGGFHLAGRAMEPRIPETVRDLLERVQPKVVAPGHCTGWRAKAALSQAFAPGRYAPSVVGSRYTLGP